MSFFSNFGSASASAYGAASGAAGPSRSKANVDNVKFYELLGVARTASEVEIKKAYRKQAMQHHPDKGGEPEVFKQITRAYEILSDSQKRAIYDEAGEEGLEHGGGAGGGMGMDIFDLFGMRGTGRSTGRRRGEDVTFPLKVTYEDLYNGTTRKLRLTKNVLCGDCGGKGGSNAVTCKDCKGQGIRMMIRQLGPGMIQQMQTTCQTCTGTGTVIPDGQWCKTCMGEKTVKEKKTLEIYVNKGMLHGMRITFSGEADEAPETAPGDVIVVLQQQEHSIFRRDGAHLFYKKQITLLEALTGFQFVITHLDGRQLLVQSSPDVVYKPGDIKVIREEGFPLHRNPYIKGNLYIEFEIIFPVSGSLSAHTKQQLQSLLPRPASLPSPSDASTSPCSHMDTSSTATPSASASASSTAPELVELLDVDPSEDRRQFDAATRHESSDEEDDEGQQQGTHQAQCRQQ